tara:strand:+ start:292 stop:1077 length:786 start_codon:yes stop_codon:yes gene_type:complete
LRKTEENPKGTTLNKNEELKDFQENKRILIVCDCGKKYKHKSSYSRHIKNCNKKNTVVEDSFEISNYEDSDIKKILKDILKENKELKNEIKNIKTTTNNNISINVFLNENCKDAMNLTDFIENMKLSIEDLQYSGKYGYVKGMSNILMKNLTDIDPKQRPLHCSDPKRLKFYVKENDEWERDTDNKKIDQSMDNITKKQHKILKDWVVANPNYEDSKLKMDEYFSIVRSLMGGIDKEEELQNKCRVIKHVSAGTNIKEVIN